MKLQEELDKIYILEEANNMKFNPDKLYFGLYNMEKMLI